MPLSFDWPGNGAPNNDPTSHGTTGKRLSLGIRRQPSLAPGNRDRAQPGATYVVGNPAWARARPGDGADIDRTRGLRAAP